MQSVGAGNSGRDQKGSPPRIGPCIAQRGGAVCPTVFGPLAGVFFGGDVAVVVFGKTAEHEAGMTPPEQAV
jgi:hypothetical protein